MRIYLFTLIALLYGLNVRAQDLQTQCPKSYSATTIVFGFDAFRWDIIDRYDTPNLKQIRDTGIRANMRPRFPSLTFVNFYAMATGLNPENNGVVGNAYYAPDLGRIFDKRAWSQSEWWKGEPIWETLQRQGGSAAISGWVGSDAGENYRRPNMNITYNYYGTLSFDERLNTVFHALDLPDNKRPQFISLYLEQPDATSHHFGVNSSEEREMIAKIDALVGKFTDGLRERNIENCVNFVIIGDHGMTNTPIENTIFIEDILKDGTYRKDALGYGTYLQVWPINNDIESVFNSIPKSTHYKAYKKQDIPSRFNIKNNIRTAPIIITPEEGWKFCNKDNKNCLKTRAMHGYDNDFKSMQSSFIAKGPMFKKGIYINHVENIDLYPLMSFLLGISPAKNDGNICHFKDGLKTIPAECK